MYTMTPTEDFILDFLPGSDSRVAIAAGFSGHGFKLAPLVGRIMAELATKGARPHNLTGAFRSYCSRCGV